MNTTNNTNSNNGTNDKTKSASSITNVSSAPFKTKSPFFKWMARRAGVEMRISGFSRNHTFCTSTVSADKPTTEILS